MSTALRLEAIESGLINEAAHEQLLADIEGYTRIAGIPEHFVWTSINDYCGYEEVGYVSTIKDSLTTGEGEAIGMVADRLSAVRDRHGPDAVAGLASAKCTNEENYLFQKLMRAVIGTHNVDHCARL